MSEAAAMPNRPFRRAVFYVAGFDNIGVRFYYMMFRSGLAHEFGRAKRPFKVDRPEPVGELASRWRIETVDAGRAVNVDYYFLTPQDLLREFNEGSALRLISAWLYTVFIYFRRGIIFRAIVKSWKSVVLLTVLFCFAAFFALGAGIAAGILAALGNPLPALASAAIIIAAGAVGLRFGVRFTEKTYVKLALLALYVGALQAQGRLPQLERRAAEWARFIRENTSDADYDEVLIVGHSSGVVAAADVAAELLRNPGPRHRLPLALLTLGSIDTAVSAFRGKGDTFARRHHAALADLAASPDIVWVEFYSPWDFICIGSYDAVTISGVDLGGRARRGPILREVDLWRTLEPESYRRMFFNMFARHFQYLRGLDRPGDYSFFRLCCQAQPLA